MATVTSFIAFLLCFSVLLPAASESRQTAEGVYRLMPPVPCSCTKVECSCCADMNLKEMKFKQKGCLNFKYDLSKELLKIDTLVNDTSIFKAGIPARNTPPICFPVPLPLPIFSICVRIRDIHWENQNLHICATLEVQVNSYAIFAVPFDCVYIGAGGIGLVKNSTVPSTYSVRNQTLKT